MPPDNPAPFPTRDFLGVLVAVSTRAEALKHLLSGLVVRHKTAVAFANTNLVNLAHRGGFADALSRRFVIFNDGVGLDVFSRVCHGAPFPENLNGTDLTAEVLSAVPDGTRVFLFGAQPEVVARAATVLEERFKIRIVGACDGYVSAEAAAALPECINDADTDVVLVALGNPRQEQWIMRHADAVNAPLLMGVGAFFDFVAGVVPRAPVWVRKLRLEWLFRVAQEPSRLWRRYTVDGVKLAFALMRGRSTGRKPAP